MIHKVFHHMSRTFAHHRCVDRIAQRIYFSSLRQNVLTTGYPISRICCYSDLCTFSNIKEKHTILAGVNEVSPNYLPRIIPKLLYSTKECKKEKPKEKPYESVSSEDEEISKRQSNTSTVDSVDDEKSLSIFQRFKKMYRDYWYVLVPVHVITSLGWFGGFYYMAKSGVDIVEIVEMLGVSDHIPDVLKDSSAGYLAVSYALYKIATPVRYMVTIGGTTISIKYLKQYGYIKPIPPKEKLKEMYQERKENLKERRQHFADEFKQKRDQLKGRKNTLMRERRHHSQK